MRDLLAKLVNGAITRRDFARNMAKVGFGAMAAESVLDVVASAGQTPQPGDFQFEPYSSRTYYDQWCAAEGVPVHTGWDARDVRKLEIKDWKRLGVRGAIIDLTGSEATDGAFVFELAPGQSTRPQRFMFEETTFVLDGDGETTVWYERGHEQTFKWQKSSLFSPPLNTWRRHRNRGSKPARLITFHDAPLMMDLLHNASFIFNNDFVFRDRYNNQPDFFVMNDSKLKGHGSAATFGEGERSDVKLVETGLVPDVNQLELHEAKSRGARNKSVEMVLSENTMQTHISEFETGTYKRAHRHGPGSHVMSLEGQGYTLLWKDTPHYSDSKEAMRIDWQEGSLFVPPDRWFHQHFNIGSSPARYMATTWIGGKYWAKALGGGGRTHRLNTVPFAQGGNMIDYTVEDPKVRDMFEAELKKTGVPLRMPGTAKEGK
jgi:quercetin dioxygenase-like cupin family protein